MDINILAMYAAWGWVVSLLLTIGLLKSKYFQENYSGVFRVAMCYIALFPGAQVVVVFWLLLTYLMNAEEE